MPSINLPQAVADALLAMAKRKTDNAVWRFLDTGGRTTIPLESLDGREHFQLDLHMTGPNFLKKTFQNRARTSVVLARLDFAGPPHRNPDDVEVPTPHLHLYIQGDGAKWAVPLPCERFSDLTDTEQTLREFMQFINVTDPPNIR